MMCDSTNGYIHNVLLYTGKQDGLFIPELGAAASIIVRLRNIHVIHMDSFYSSPLFYRYLKQEGINQFSKP